MKDPDVAGGARPVSLLGQNGLVRIARDCRPIMAEDARKLPILIALSFVMGLLEAFLILLVVQMAVALAAEKDRFEVTLGPVSADDLSIRVGVLGGAALVVGLITCLVPVARLAGHLAARAQHRTRRRLLDAYLRASWEVRSRYPEGHLQELLTTYSVRAERAVNQLVVASVALCGLTSILFVAFASSAAVAAVAIVCVGAVGSLLRPVMTRTRTASVTYAADDRDFAGRMAEIARVTPEITAFDVAHPVEAVVDVRAAAVAESLRKIRTLMRLGSSLYQYLALLLVVLAIGAVSLFASAGALATLGTVLILLVRALSYGQQLQTQIQTSHETGPFLESMAAEIATLTAAAVDRTGELIDAPVPLHFDAVWFAYEPGDFVLKGVSLEIGPGEALGVVGRSGAGKSTLVQLLLRLRRPTGGRITVGGLSLDDVALERWYQLVAYVPQDNKLISGTVADNIRFFREGLSRATVEDAARRAHLHDEIVALPEDYDTVIGPGVRDLSGGQRQRLGIARALAGSPRLIILDEPTSALDERSERLITRTLSDLRGQVTIVIVAHRPTTTAMCDRIIRIADGRITLVPPTAVEAGPLTAPSRR